MRAGREQEAIDWAQKHKLFFPIEGALHVTLPAAHAGNGAGLPELVATAAPKAASADCSPVYSPLPAATASPLAASSGGAGVDDTGLAQNLDQSAHRVENPQLRTGGLAGGNGGQGASSTLGSAADAASLASPSGEVEGNKQSCQGDKGGLFSNRLEKGGWLVSGEGVVGGNCRNKWFVEVSVGGQWAKAAIGDVQVRRGTRVRVRLEWVSADGRDAEYAIVEALPDLAEPVQAKPVGFAEQNARNVPIAKETAKEAKPADVQHKMPMFYTLPPQSLGLHQTGVQTVHDQPKEVIFQTTTLEQIVEKEKVGVMHASGKTGPMPRAEEYRSPVLDDVPAPPAILDDADFMDRARAQAYKELLGQG